MEVTRSERAVLSVLRGSRRPMKAGEIAERAGLKLRTAYYALEQLRGKGMVERTWDGYRLRERRAQMFEAIYISWGIVCILASVPLNNPVLTVFGSVNIILGRLAKTLEKRLS